MMSRSVDAARVNELEARLAESLEHRAATSDILRVIRRSRADVQPVFDTIVENVVRLCGADHAYAARFDGELLHPLAFHGFSPDALALVSRRFPMRPSRENVLGRVALERQVVNIPNVLDDPDYSHEFAIAGGWRSLLGVPMLRDGELIGAIGVGRAATGAFPPQHIELLRTFADQAVIAVDNAQLFKSLEVRSAELTRSIDALKALGEIGQAISSSLGIQNARLFREIADKGRQLEVASRHKSQFLASMSHELRTPLNAILGFNELILGEIYGEVPVAMREPLTDIQASGRHLLRLINNVLDLAKIEAGRMELALADYAVQDVVESVRTTLRSLASEKGLKFEVTVPADLPLAHGDSGRIVQCLVNLAGNALKFTQQGEVRIAVSCHDDWLTYRVADTGIGIPPEKLQSLFTEFKQTDATIASEYGGTGLGLAITKKFVEMHGGRIWVESVSGKGSTFAFELPVRAHAPAPHERENRPVRRGQRFESQDRARTAAVHELPPDRGARWRGWRRDGHRTAPRSHSDGHSTTQDFRPRGDADVALASVHDRHADHRDHLVRTAWRRPEGAGSRGHRVHDQALQPVRSAGPHPQSAARSVSHHPVVPLQWP
jgi:signal transduction histidine kinase